MITNQNDITKYSDMKIFIPEDYVNQNWHYYFNGDYIIVVTNNNCTQQYNTTYCSCYSYNYKNNVISESNTCNANPNLYRLNYSVISSNINDSSYIRSKFTEDKTVLLLIGLVAILILATFLKGR